MRVKHILLVLLLGLLLVPAAARAEDDPRKAQMLTEFYTRMLAHPDLLGFHPDAAIVCDVMDHIRDEFVDPVSNRQMEEGIVHHVSYLLRVANIPTDALASMPVNDDLPAKIMDVGSKVNRDVLGWAEIQGIFEPTGDPHSALLPPSSASKMTGTLDETSFAGIGVHIERDPKTSQIIFLDIIDDAPAARAGLLPGDVLMKIDGLPTGGMSAELVTSLMRGAVGSSMVLNISRNGSLRDVTLVRAAIHPKSVSSKILPGGIGYIKLSSFSANSGTELQAVLLQWKLSRAAKGYILDLRNNGGGYVRAAQEICSLFVPAGKPFMHIVGRGGVRHSLTSDGPADYAGIPLVILVNGYSASASEVTSGCLRDYQLATLVGVRTFGKGSMQAPREYAQKTLLKITIARWYTPMGTGIDHIGINPDVEVQTPPASIGKDGDAQLQKAIDILHSKIAQ